MPRVRAEDRLDDLVAAAAGVFRTRGYRRTQMADVARAFNVSPGALYNYVESKQALFHLVVDRAFGGPRQTGKTLLPIPTPPPGATLKRLREVLEAGQHMPALEAALARRRVGNVRVELEGIVRELYERFERGREGGDLIERSALDLPELAQLWFGDVRHAFFERVTEYIRRRTESGHLLRMPDAALAARIVIETTVFFARHRHRDPFERIDDIDARETVVAFVLSALVPETRLVPTESGG